MIEKCPECGEKIDILPIQEMTFDTTGSQTITGTLTFSTTGQTYAPTNTIYKCSNPKCWVTKITENWE